jgi:hypothetical protein
MWIILVFILTVQMTTLNVMGPASFYYAPYGQQLEQQQSSCLSVQEQYIPAVTGFIQPIGPMTINPCVMPTVTLTAYILTWLIHTEPCYTDSYLYYRIKVY